MNNHVLFVNLVSELASSKGPCLKQVDISSSSILCTYHKAAQAVSINIITLVLLKKKNHNIAFFGYGNDLLNQYCFAIPLRKSHIMPF